MNAEPRKNVFQLMAVEDILIPIRLLRYLMQPSNNETTNVYRPFFIEIKVGIYRPEIESRQITWKCFGIPISFDYLSLLIVFQSAMISIEILTLILFWEIKGYEVTIFN